MYGLKLAGDGKAGARITGGRLPVPIADFDAIGVTCVGLGRRSPRVSKIYLTLDNSPRLRREIASPGTKATDHELYNKALQARRRRIFSKTRFQSAQDAVLLDHIEKYWFC